jgi:hypothetical protein
VRFAGEEEKEESPKKQATEPAPAKKSFFMLGDDTEDLLWNVVSLP